MRPVLQVRLVTGDVAALGVRTTRRVEAVGLREASLGVLLRATRLDGGALRLGLEALRLGTCPQGVRLLLGRGGLELGGMQLVLASAGTQVVSAGTSIHP